MFLNICAMYYYLIKDISHSTFYISHIMSKVLAVCPMYIFKTVPIGIIALQKRLI